MKTVQTVQSFDKIKLLADSRRMDILRLLMATPATLTQLARTLKQSPAWVRHHILALESADLVEISETKQDRQSNGNLLPLQSRCFSFTRDRSAEEQKAFGDLFGQSRHCH
jgi:DNA-binding transcriptional ArsR family regulator